MTGADPREAIETFYAARPPARLGVAVSGGSDSLALLVLLAERGGAELCAATVDHGLRPEAASEALHVARICEGLGVPHSVLPWQGWDGKGNLQDLARRTRYALLAEWARGLDLDAIAVGHTEDDQAETVLMRLARGPGVDGLSGMRGRMVRDGMRFHRPFLTGVRRADLREMLSARGIRWVEDPSNDDPGFERVRARRVLAALSPLGIDPAALARTAAHLQDARAALDWATADAAEAVARVGGGDVIFDRAAFRRLPRELQRRLLGHTLEWLSGADHPPRRGPLSDALGAVAAQENTVLHGARILTSAMTVRITREHAAVADVVTSTDGLWDGRWRADGPHAEDLHIAALGEGIAECPAWRDSGLPRATLLASPAIWRGWTLIAAPLAGMPEGWSVRAPGLDDLVSFLSSH